MTAPMHRIYVRALPGGGFVAIDVVRVWSLFRRRYRGRIVIERRSAERRTRHPLVLATTEAPRVSPILDELLPLAQSNPALAARCLCTPRASGRAQR